LFIPERWLDEKAPHRNESHAYLPFSAGKLINAIYKYL